MGWNRGRGSATSGVPDVPTYSALLAHVAPVFLILAVGWVLRRVRWLQPESDASMLRLGVYVLYPCLIADTILGNEALRDVRQIMLPIGVGAATVLVGLGVGALVARLLDLTWPQPARTFAFTSGMFNYGFIPIPIIAALFDRATMGVLFTYTLGVEFMLWSAGIALLSGHRGEAWWRSAFNAPVLAIIISTLWNFTAIPLPGFTQKTMHWLGECAFPVQLILTGTALHDAIRRGWPGGLARTVFVGNLVRLVVLPLLMLGGAALLGSSIELQRVAVVQAAMPCAMIPVILARHYHGDVDMAAWIVATTTAIGLFTIPLWLRVGFGWLGI